MSSATFLQDAIVAVCVLIAVAYVLRGPLSRLRGKPVAKSGCGSGCGTCGSCEPKTPSNLEKPIQQKTIHFHR